MEHNKTDIKTVDEDAKKYSREKQSVNEQPNIPAGKKKPLLIKK